MKQIADHLWTFTYPLPMLGADVGRTVTVIRLGSGDLVIHSTGPFTPADVAAISELGRPAYLVDSMLRHDTFVREGRSAFPGLPFYAPEGFSQIVGFPTESLATPPAEWAPDLETLQLAGEPKAREYVFLHRPSKTLIVADLIFNVPDDAPLGTRLLAYVAIGKEHHPGMPRTHALLVKDKEAFHQSLEQVLSWDFDRIIVGHGETVESDGQRLLAEAARRAGF